MTTTIATRKRKVHAYYSFDKLYSHNAVYNFAVGGRGIGKTYGAKKKAIKNGIEKGEQFIYLRRYKTELSTRTTFFADIAHEFPNVDFRVNGASAQYAPIETRDDKKRQWHTIGYFLTLASGQAMKGTAFPLVTLIIFDEFILEDGALHYLPDEATIFNNFYSTVDRYQDKTRVLFLANSVSIMNPYFIEWEIRPQAEFVTAGKNDEGKPFVAVHFADSNLFAKTALQTRFGQFIDGTDYAKYAVSNEFDDNNDRLVNIKDSRATYQFTIELRKGSYSVWHSAYTGDYFAQVKRPKEEIIYTMEADLMEDGKVLMLPNDKLVQILRSAFKTGILKFDKPSSRNAFIDIFRK